MMRPIDELAMAEAALLATTQTTATWSAIESIRRARYGLVLAPTDPQTIEVHALKAVGVGHVVVAGD